jgi:hypothetical protein
MARSILQKTFFQFNLFSASIWVSKVVFQPDARAANFQGGGGGPNDLAHQSRQTTSYVAQLGNVHTTSKTTITSMHDEKKLNIHTIKCSASMIVSWTEWSKWSFSLSHLPFVCLHWESCFISCGTLRFLQHQNSSLREGPISWARKDAKHSSGSWVQLCGDTWTKYSKIQWGFHE